MLHIIHGEFPGNVIAVNAIGEVCDKDYEEMLLPAIKKRLESYEKVNLLYMFGFVFDDYDTAMPWSDTSVGVEILSRIDKLAIVSNATWLEKGVKLLSIFMPQNVQFYTEQHFADAKAWVSETQ